MHGKFNLKKQLTLILKDINEEQVMHSKSYNV